jgi:hypothetical protein
MAQPGSGVVITADAKGLLVSASIRSWLFRVMVPFFEITGVVAGPNPCSHDTTF